MNRREILRTSGAMLAGGTAAAAVLSVPDDASAQASAELDIAGDQAALDADGQIAAVWLDASVGWAYELPDSAQPSTVIVELATDTTTVTVERDGLDPSEYGAVAGSGALTIEIE